MLDRITEPTLPARSHLLTPTLVVRESCGTYLSGAGLAPTAAVRRKAAAKP